MRFRDKGKALVFKKISKQNRRIGPPESTNFVLKRVLAFSSFLVIPMNIVLTPSEGLTTRRLGWPCPFSLGRSMRLQKTTGPIPSFPSVQMVFRLGRPGPLKRPADDPIATMARLCLITPLDLPGLVLATS